MVERHSVSTRSPEKVAHEPTWSVEAGHGFHLLDPRQFFGVLKRLLPVVRTLVLLALVIAGNPVGPTPEPANGLEFHRSTKVGQTAALALEDDSQIHLNTDTSITIAEGPRRRDVVLERGEVFAEVRHDELRPFRIAVGHVVVEDLGTRLDVYTDDGKTRVTVIEGKVRILERRANGSMVDPFVASSEGFKREGAMLGVGDVVKVEEHDDGTAIVYKEPTDTAAAARNIQWLQGKLDFTGQSLAEVVYEINRYNSLRLVIDDPSIAGLRIGGRIDVGDPNAFVELLRARDRIRTTVIAGDGGSVREIHLRGPPGGKGQR
jgi:transmembrane sensor